MYAFFAHGKALPSAPQDKAQPLHSLPLCREAESIVKQCGISPKRVAILPSGNSLPYNILAPICINPAERRARLILAFQMEDAVLHRECITRLLEVLKEGGAPCYALFTYGDTLPYQGAMIVRGTASFVHETGGEDIACICVSWASDEEDKVIRIANGGGGDSTPEVMLRQICRAISSVGAKYSVSAGSFGSLYRFDILKADERASAIIRAGGYACAVRFPFDDGDSIADRVLSCFVQNTSGNTGNWGSTHYAAFRTQNRLVIIGERYIVIIFIVASFLGALFVCLPGGKKRVESVKKDILKVAPSLPVTLVLTTLSLIAGQYTARIYHADMSMIALSFIKLSVAFASITVLYCLFITYLRPLGSRRDERAYGEELYCQMLLAVSLFNMLVFSAIDISTVFLFALEYAIVLAARRAHTLPALIFACILMLLPYAPYLSVLIKYAKPDALKKILYAEPLMNALYALLCLPHLMQWLRILSRIYASRGEMAVTGAQKAAQRAHTIRAIFASSALTLSFILAGAALLAVTGLFKAGDTDESGIRMKEAKDDVLKCTVNDDTFFGDTLRTITIDTGQEAVEVITTAQGERGCTVLYCDDFYISNEAQRTDTFRLPAYPPRRLTFAFSADDTQPSIITVIALYDTGTPSDYEVRKCVMHTKAQNGK